MLIDSHCHLDRLKLDKYDGDLELAIEAARDAGVGKMLCVGISLDNREQVTKLARSYDDVVASVGVHPLDIKAGLASEDQLLEWGKSPEVVALGETGLDYYYSENDKGRTTRKLFDSSTRSCQGGIAGNRAHSQRSSRYAGLNS